jgi:hypothetical protein
VYGTAVLIADLVVPGSLFWVAPLQYVTEQMGVRFCEQNNMMDRVDEVQAYLMAGLQEYAVALVADFDMDHFEAWTAAAAASDAPSV